MIVWSGFGILVPMVYVLEFYLLGYLGLYDKSQSNTNLVFALSFFIPATVILWIAGRKLNFPGLKVFNKQDVLQNFRFRGGHSFFFLTIEVWALMTGIAGLVLIVKSFTA